MCARPSSKGSSVNTGERAAQDVEFSPIWFVSHATERSGYHMEVIERIKQGVKKSDWKNLINRIGHTEKELDFMIPASISSLQKRSVYDKETSERIYELARLYGLGFDVFDTEQDFKTWLDSPSKALGGKKPFELLDSSFGFELVEQEVLRIRYNVYS